MWSACSSGLQPGLDVTGSFRPITVCFNYNLVWRSVMVVSVVLLFFLLTAPTAALLPHCLQQTKHTPQHLPSLSPCSTHYGCGYRFINRQVFRARMTQRPKSPARVQDWIPNREVDSHRSIFLSCSPNGCRAIGGENTWDNSPCVVR